MEIKDIQANQGNIDIVAVIVEKEEPRSFEKFGKVGKVCNAKLKDDSGEIKLTLWNDDIEKVNQGDKIHLENGWCSEFRNEKQLSTGKSGKIEVLGAAENTVYTNDPSLLGKPQEGTNPEGEQSDDTGPVSEEEFVE